MTAYFLHNIAGSFSYSDLFVLHAKLLKHFKLTNATFTFFYFMAEDNSYHLLNGIKTNVSVGLIHI